MQASVPAQSPGVTVIVPVYNGEKYLRSCLNSLLAQDFHDWEAICINDGSADSSLAILQQYAAKEPRIRIIDKKNEGVAIARNCGLAAAQGEYITMLDCDDSLPTSALSSLVGSARQHPEADIVMGGVTMVWPDGKSYDLGALNYGNNFSGSCPVGNIIIHLYGFAVAKLFKRSIISHYQIIQQPGLHIGEDMEFALHYLSYSRSSYIHQNTTYNYRQHGSSVSNAYSSGISPIHYYSDDAGGKLHAIRYIGVYWDSGRSHSFAYGCAFLFFRQIWRACSYNYRSPSRLIPLLGMALCAIPKLMRYLPLPSILSAARLGLSKEPGVIEKIKSSIRYRITHLAARPGQG